jgi:hypothetical protein
MIKVIRGDTWNLSWTYLNGDETPVDLTGCSIRMHMKKFFDAIPTLEFETDDFEIDNEEGLISLQILPDISTTLSGTYLYDIEITSPDGEVRTIILDEIRVDKDVTQ